jgi:hypothetical protein
MSGLDHFHVDFFLMGDVDGYYRFLAEKDQSESDVLPEAQQLSPLQATDWAIFISDSAPYAELKAWLVENAGFMASTSNAFYLRYDCHTEPTSTTVALIPFGELQNQECHWLPTGFGMATDINGINFDPMLDFAPIHIGRCEWLPMTVPEIMLTQLLSFKMDSPVIGSYRIARGVSSIIENYKYLEHSHVFLFHSDAYPDAEAAASYSKLELLECNARVLGRQIFFTMQACDELDKLLEVLYCKELNSFLKVHTAEELSDLGQQAISLFMSRPRYYGDPTVLSHATCYSLLSSMAWGLHEPFYL